MHIARREFISNAHDEVNYSTFARGPSALPVQQSPEMLARERKRRRNKIVFHVMHESTFPLIKKNPGRWASLSSYHKWKLCKFGLCDLYCGPYAISRSAASPYIRARAVCTFTYIRTRVQSRRQRKKKLRRWQNVK